MKFISLLILLGTVILLSCRPCFAEQIPTPVVTTTFQNCSNASHRSTWCKTGGKRLSRYHQHKFAKNIFGNSLKETSNIFLSTFSYNTPFFHELFCNPDSPPQNIVLSVDAAYQNDKDLLSFKRKCDASKNGKLQILSPVKSLGESKYRIYHSKLFIIDAPNQKTLKLIYGTANISRATFAIHFDLWNTVEVKRESQFARQHMCYQEAIITTAAVKHNDKETFQNSLEQCRKREHLLPFEEALHEEGIAALFLPEPENVLSKFILREIDKLKQGETLRIASQLFTYQDLASALRNAAQRGVNVEVILEDDTLTGTGQSRRTSAFFKKNFEYAPIHFKFIETNDKVPQYFHMRYLIIGDDLLITGSGQLSYSGMNSNYENFYISRNSKSIENYKHLHQKLWNVGYKKEDFSPTKENSFIEKMKSFLKVLL